jgi:hypothetical protein
MHAREASRIDPMQNPKRPGYFMNYAQDETPAEMVLRKLACWLGVGGYNAPTVDADLFHDKIVAGINYLVESASSPQSHPGGVRADSLEDIIDAYLEGYEFEGDEGGHSPGDFERFVIKDAIMGLLADEAFIAASASTQSPPVAEGAVGDKTPGSDWHLTLLMAPHHLNLVVGSDRQHLLAWGRDVWRAALSAHGVKQPEPADTARIDWIERKAAEGWTPNLVYDDDGHFAVSFEGFQPIPQGDGAGYAEPVTVGAFVEPGDWHPSVRAAIDAAMSKEQPIHEARPDDRKEQT